LDVVGIDLRLAGTRRPFGIAAGGLRLRQQDPRSLRQELLPERRLSYARGGLRYTLQIHSDQNSCVEPALVGATATDAAGSAPENTGDAREPQPLLDRDAEFEEQRKVVLHDWQLYHAGKEG
jgi:hypothetical protein